METHPTGTVFFSPGLACRMDFSTFLSFFSSGMVGLRSSFLGLPWRATGSSFIQSFWAAAIRARTLFFPFFPFLKFETSFSQECRLQECGTNLPTSSFASAEKKSPEPPPIKPRELFRRRLFIMDVFPTPNGHLIPFVPPFPNSIIPRNLFFSEAGLPATKRV